MALYGTYCSVAAGNGPHAIYRRLLTNRKVVWLTQLLLIDYRGDYHS